MARYGPVLNESNRSVRCAIPVVSVQAGPQLFEEKCGGRTGSRGEARMEWSSWFRRILLKDNSKATTADPSNLSFSKQYRSHKSDLEEHGITDKLVDLVRTFTVDTFKSFPLQDDGDEPGRDVESGATSAENSKRDLSEWQERHASLVLARVKELAQLRYVLCPCQMKELRFWEIYFMLVRSHVAEYELRAIRLAKLNEMKNGNGKTSEGNGFEVEMSESLPSTAQEPIL